MTSTNLHHPTSVTLEYGDLHRWITIRDAAGNGMTVHFGEAPEGPSRFAVALIAALLAPRTVVEVK